MTTAVHTVIYPLSDLGKANALYGKLLGGIEPVMDQPYYVQFNVDGLQIGLDPHGHRKGMAKPVSYWHLDAIKQTIAELTETGAEEVQAVTDFGGRLVASVKDTAGNTVGLIQLS